MISHWSERRAEIAAQLAGHKRIFIGCDFDGTLAPIVDEPDAAALPDAARDVLTALAAVPGVHVAIVSGRALRDVRKRVGIEELSYVGNHGLEMAGRDFGEWNAPVTCTSRMELQAALSRIHDAVGGVPGVLIEDKHLTGTIHFRMAADDTHETIARAVHLVANERRALTAHAGRKVWELRPLLAWNKGVAVRSLLAHFSMPGSAAICFGDDTTDENMFRDMPGALTLRVGPEETKTAARFRLRDVSDTKAFLSFVLGLRTDAADHASISSIL